MSMHGQENFFGSEKQGKGCLYPDYIYAAYMLLRCVASGHLWLLVCVLLLLLLRVVGNV